MQPALHINSHPNILQSSEQVPPTLPNTPHQGIRTYRMTNWVRFPIVSGIGPVRFGLPATFLRSDKKTTTNKYFLSKLSCCSALHFNSQLTSMPPPITSPYRPLKSSTTCTTLQKIHKKKSLPLTKLSDSVNPQSNCSSCLRAANPSIACTTHSIHKRATELHESAPANNLMDNLRSTKSVTKFGTSITTFSSTVHSITKHKKKIHYGNESTKNTSAEQIARLQTLGLMLPTRMQRFSNCEGQGAYNPETVVVQFPTL